MIRRLCGEAQFQGRRTQSCAFANSNKNALIRYRTIDKCLQNRQRRWTLNDLITACSEALYEYEGKEMKVSKRTVQLDIQMMRSDKLGYNAPIEVYERKYYRYEEEDEYDEEFGERTVEGRVLKRRSLAVTDGTLVPGHAEVETTTDVPATEARALTIGWRVAR